MCCHNANSRTKINFVLPYCVLPCLDKLLSEYSHYQCTFGALRNCHSWRYDRSEMSYHVLITSCLLNSKIFSVSFQSSYTRYSSTILLGWFRESAQPRNNLAPRNPNIICCFIWNEKFCHCGEYKLMIPSWMFPSHVRSGIRCSQTVRQWQRSDTMRCRLRKPAV